MRKRLCLGVAAILLLALSGCGGGDHRTAFVAEIFSDPRADGDIAFDPVLSSFTITNGPSTVFFGIDRSTATQPEYRAYLDFPRDGSTGGDLLPGDARIRSATIELFIDQVRFAATVPTRIDLVQYPVSGLRTQDFDSPALASRAFAFFSSDEGHFVSFDVTALMAEALRLGLPELQVRLLLDSVPGADGLVGIEDLPRVLATAPLLIVEYE